MDDAVEIDGGGQDQVPELGDGDVSAIGSPREAPNPEAQDVDGDGEFHSGGEEEEPGDYVEDYSEDALDLSGSTTHRISPSPSDGASSRPGRSSPIIPQV
jgi:hypothetical protein